MKWLFLVHQLQTRNSRERVKVWRLTKKVGALLYRNSVYVLPYSKARLEDFQWLCQQIRDSQGEAAVFFSDSADERENRTLQALFSRTRESEYMVLLDATDKVLMRIRRAKKEKRLSESLRRSLEKEAAHLGESLSEIEKIDFFGIPIKKKVKMMIELAKKELVSAEAASRTSPPPRHSIGRCSKVKPGQLGKTFT